MLRAVLKHVWKLLCICFVIKLPGACVGVETIEPGQVNSICNSSTNPQMQMLYVEAQREVIENQSLQLLQWLDQPT